MNHLQSRQRRDEGQRDRAVRLRRAIGMSLPHGETMCVIIARKDDLRWLSGLLLRESQEPEAAAAAKGEHDGSGCE
jgi:hypothetical protein